MRKIYGTDNKNALDETISGDKTFTGNNTFSGDNDFTGLVDNSTGEFVVSNGTPINAKAADVQFLVNTRPANYVANVQATRTYTVAGEPDVNVQSSIETAIGGNSDLRFEAVAAGTSGDGITVTYTDPSSNDALLIISVVGSDIDVSLATDGVGAITSTANEILAAMNLDVSASALVTTSLKGGSDGTGVVTAMAAITTAGGVDATTLVIGTDTYTFVSGTPGALEIEADGTTNTCANIALLSPLADVEIVDNLDDTFTITALFGSLPGVAGNGYTITPDGVFITGTANLAGGVDEVMPKYVINSIDYIFCDTVAGDDPSVDYPSCIPVDTLTAASTATTATAFAAALASETNTFDTAYAVGSYVYARYKTKGVVGNAIPCVNSLVTPANITDDATGDVLTGGIDGTPGYKGQLYCNGWQTWRCLADDYTTTNAGWRLDGRDVMQRFTLGETFAVDNAGYYKDDSKMWQTDADAEATTRGLFGIALEAGNANDEKFFQIGGELILTTPIAPLVAGKTGETVFVSTTKGGLTTTRPTGTLDAGRVVGYTMELDSAGTYVRKIQIFTSQNYYTV